MKKENFVSLILGTVGGILFALGMCMCLVAEWNAARPGVVLGAAGPSGTPPGPAWYWGPPAWRCCWSC